MAVSRRQHLIEVDELPVAHCAAHARTQWPRLDQRDVGVMARGDDAAHAQAQPLSLAYEFQPEQAAPLQAMARAMVDVAAPAGWELRLYERFGHDAWRCHAAWPLA